MTESLLPKLPLQKLLKKELLHYLKTLATFENLIKDFCTHIGQNIKSSKKLAEMMAGKARLLSDVIEKGFNQR